MEELQFIDIGTSASAGPTPPDSGMGGIVEEIGMLFFRSEGIVLSYHPPGPAPGTVPGAGSRSTRFCRLVQSTEEGRARCCRCRQACIEEARRRGSVVACTCHAGLVEMARPLIGHNGTAVCVLAGQFLAEPQTGGRFRTIAEGLDDLGLDGAALREAYFGLRVADRLQVSTYGKLMAFIAGCVTDTGDRDALRGEMTAMRNPDGGTKLSTKARLYIETHYGENIKLEDIASAMNLSPNYFSSLFRKETGWTFSRYLVKVRIENAKGFLQNSMLPIKAIVAKVGFNDYNYFNKRFREVTGFPPAEYRKTQAPQDEAQHADSRCSGVTSDYACEMLHMAASHHGGRGRRHAAEEGPREIPQRHRVSLLRLDPRQDRIRSGCLAQGRARSSDDGAG